MATPDGAVRAKRVHSQMRKRWAAYILCCAIALTALFPSRAVAQSPVDTIRGRVFLPDSSPASRAHVIVTGVAIPPSTLANLTTDSLGNYSVVVARHPAYAIQAGTLGFTSTRIRVTRNADSARLTVNVYLSGTVKPPNALETVKIVASKRTPPPRQGIDFDRQDQYLSRVLPTSGTDPNGLDAMAGTLPGMTLTPNGYSVLGLSPDQNVLALNGAQIPAAMTTLFGTSRMSLTTTSFDVSRGGFGGAEINLQSFPSWFYSNILTLTLEPSAWQRTDPVATQAGQQFSGLGIQGQHSGPVWDEGTSYSASYSLTRRAQTLNTLTTAPSDVLLRSGIAPDSVERATDILQDAGIPFVGRASPNQRLTSTASALLGLTKSVYSDDASRGGKTYSLTAALSHQDAGAQSLGPTTTASTGQDAVSTNGILQGQLAAFTGPLLNETTSTLSLTHSANTPYLAAPNAHVTLASQLADGTTAISSLAFGGSADAGTSSSQWHWNTRHQLSWMSLNRAHQYQLTGELALDGYTQSQAANELGTFTFSSLADLAAGTPSSFTRVLQPTRQHGSTVSGALALGDQWRVNDRLQLQYGVRGDAMRFGTRPAFNAAVDSVFGARTDRAPNGVWLSPRVGFYYTYGNPYEGRVTSSGAIIHRGHMGTISGGTGLYVASLQPQLLATALSGTGLPSAVQHLSCIGDAAPTPEWQQYINASSTIPATCTGGGGTTPFADTVPNVTLFDHAYAPPKSWRSTLAWSSRAAGFSFQVSGTYQLATSQPGVTDLNFSATPRFTLANEANRPVFVAPADIVAQSGVAALSGSRISTRFAQVMSQRSDLRSHAGLVTLTLSPNEEYNQYATFYRSWSVRYSYSQTRDEAGGFDQSTSGLPTLTPWGRSSADQRHRVQADYLLYHTKSGAQFSLSALAQSGMPFTPLVAGDINGDGSAINDRAFVFDPSTTTDTAVANRLRTLLTHGSASARHCLGAQLGRIAARNSCTGPWTASLNAGLQLPIGRVIHQQHAMAAVTLTNVLGGLDQLLHGNNLHGWGDTPMPDPVLLSVKGFDPTTRQFLYDVNQRFGETRPSQTTVHTPFQLSAAVYLSLGPSFRGQELHQGLFKLQHGHNVRRTADEVQGRLASRGAVPISWIVSMRDSLHLTMSQVNALETLDEQQTAQLDSLWKPVAHDLAAMLEPVDFARAQARITTTRHAQKNIAAAISQALFSILTPDQVALAPVYVQQMQNPRWLKVLDE